MLKKIKYSILTFLVGLSLSNVGAQEKLSGLEVVNKMDKNESYTSAIMDAKMIIHMNNTKREKTMKSISYDVKGVTKSMTEFTNTEDQGTKYLMIDNELWIYFPDEDDVMKISGHMLKEGMMGSDVSYEDALERDRLEDKYEIKLLGEEKIDDKNCYVIDLNAKVKKVPYHRRKIWVDKKTFVAMKEEMYAKSGKLLKESKTNKVEQVDGLWIVTESVLSDKMRKNTKTEFIISNIQLNPKVDQKKFTMRYLRR